MKKYIMSEIANMSSGREEDENQSQVSSVRSVSDASDNQSEFTEVNLNEDRVYQILNSFFETEDGESITSVLANINENIQIQNKILNHIATSFSNLKLGVEEEEEEEA